MKRFLLFLSILSVTLLATLSHSQQIPDLTAIDSVAGGDLFYCVDVSDTTDRAEGTGKKCTATQIGTAVDTNSNASTICAGTTTYLDGEGSCDDISSVYAAALGADDNYVTDAEKVVIGNTSGTNTGDQSLEWTDTGATLHPTETDDTLYTYGRIGIGTSAPSGELHVAGNIYADTAIGIGTSTPNAKLSISQSEDSKGLIISGFNVQSVNNVAINIASSGNSNIAATRYLLITSGVSRDVRINTALYVPTSGGNVGIGISSPSGKLHVAGNIYADTNIGIGTTAPGADLDVGGGTASSIDGTNDLLVADDVEIDGDLYVDGSIYGDGSFLTGISGSGDMNKSVYDTDSDNIVDSAEDLTCTNCIGETEIDSTIYSTSDAGAILTYVETNATAFEPADGTILKDADIGSTVQAYDADLTTWAGVTPSANGQSLVSSANYASMRGLLDLEAGTDFYSVTAADSTFQPLDADLTDLADGSLTGSKVGSGINGDNITDGTIDSSEVDGTIYSDANTSALVDLMTANCSSITGSADLCDGSDDGAGGSSEWTDTGSIVHPTEETVDNIAIGGTTEAGADIFLGVSGSAKFNIQGNAVDFSIYGDTVNDLIFVDGSADRVGVGTSTPAALLDIGGGTATTIDGTDDLLVADDLEVDGNIYADGYIYADGNLAVINDGTFLPGMFYNLRVQSGTTVATQVDVDSDWVALRDTSDIVAVAKSVNETCTVTTSGLNGLEASDTEGASKWYEIYVIAKQDGTVDCLLNESGTAITTMPTDYVYKQRVGHVRNNASSNFVKFYQFNDYNENDLLVELVSAGTATTYTDVVCSSAMPPTSRILIAETAMLGTTAGTIHRLKTLRKGLTHDTTTVFDRSKGTGSITQIATDENQTFQYLVTSGDGDNAYITSLGYIEGF